MLDGEWAREGGGKGGGPTAGTHGMNPQLSGGESRRGAHG